MPHLLDDIDGQMRSALADAGEPTFRLGQIRKWVLQRRVDDWQQMTNLPLPLRERMGESLPLWRTQIVRHTRADDGTEKLLLRVEGGGQIECVLLRDRVRRTVCISTQVGCAMGCVFCASGLDGVERNLRTGEILEQILRLQLLLGDQERISHVVLMGMGEPLANLDALLPALAEVNRGDGLGIGNRRITVSTVGLPPAIRRLAMHQPHYRLAVSLHAPNDVLRNELVPVNAKSGLDEILAAADEYFAVSGRQLTFEYVLLANINDRPDQARELAQLLRGREAMINVIPYNHVSGLPYRTPTSTAQNQFRHILEQAGLNVRFRHRKGNRIDAACGQLRRRSQLQPESLPIL